MTHHPSLLQLWLDAHDTVEPNHILPLLKRGWHPFADLPSFVVATNTITVEPYITLLREVYAMQEQVGDAPILTDLANAIYALSDRLYALAYQTVPNPDYDEERAAAFCATHPTTCGRTFHVGQNSTPPLK